MLPHTFWAESMFTIVHIINLSPSLPLEDDIPQRVQTGKDVCHKHIKVFGCRAFVHIPRDEKSKLAKTTKQCIFLGHSEDEFGYRFWDPISKKVIRSRDVVFFENQTIEEIDKSSHSESPSITGVHPNPVFLDPSPRTHGGDTQEDDDHDDDDNNCEDGNKLPEQPPTPVEPQLRRSTRQKQPSFQISLQ